MALYRGCGTPARGRRLVWAWELRWGEVKPFPGLIGAVGGLRWELDVERAAGGGLNRGGAVPVCWGGGGGVGEHQ